MMPDAEYERIFGQVSDEFPFGNNVYKGMTELFTQYVKSTKQGWHLAGAHKFLGSFKAPGTFSKDNARSKFTEYDELHGTTYPAMFFRDPDSLFLYMLCLKQVIAKMKYWYVDPSRVGRAFAAKKDSKDDWNPEKEGWTML